MTKVKQEKFVVHWISRKTLAAFASSALKVLLVKKVIAQNICHGNCCNSLKIRENCITFSRATFGVYGIK